MHVFKLCFYAAICHFLPPSLAYAVVAIESVTGLLALLSHILAVMCVFYAVNRVDCLIYEQFIFCHLSAPPGYEMKETNTRHFLRYFD